MSENKTIIGDAMAPPQVIKGTAILPPLLMPNCEGNAPRVTGRGFAQETAADTAHATGETYPPDFWNRLGNAVANGLDRECATPEGGKAFYAGDGVARATVLRDQALALAQRFASFIRA